MKLVAAQAGLEGSRAETLQPLYVLMLAAGLVLLIACANIAGLLLSRASAREQEMAVRLALGASRGRLLWQMLTENIILACAGGGLGLLVAVWGARLVRVVSARGDAPPDFAPHLDFRALSFTAFAAILTGLLFGLAPAFRGLGFSLAPTLKMSGAGGPGRRSWRSLGNILVVAQVALAMVSLVSAGFLVHALANLQSADLGFDSSHLLVFGVDPPQGSYTGPKVDILLRDLQEKFAAIPGVTSVSYSWTPLLNGWMMHNSFHVPGAPEALEGTVNILPVGPKFFQTMRIPFKMGRGFLRSRVYR